MGNNSITRGQLRPHFGGRNPPFLVAALCVGLGILGISYYSLSTQYAALQDRIDSLSQEEQFVQNKLELKDKEMAKLKIDSVKKTEELNGEVQKREEELSKLREDIAKDDERGSKINEELHNKIQELADARSKIEEVEKQNVQLTENVKKLQTENQKLKTEMNNLIANREASKKPNIVPSNQEKAENKNVIDIPSADHKPVDEKNKNSLEADNFKVDSGEMKELENKEAQAAKLTLPQSSKHALPHSEHEEHVLPEPNTDSKHDLNQKIASDDFGAKPPDSIVIPDEKKIEKVDQVEKHGLDPIADPEKADENDNGKGEPFSIVGDENKREKLVNPVSQKKK